MSIDLQSYRIAYPYNEIKRNKVVIYTTKMNLENSVYTT
jgi:hypothetical protein